MYKDTRGHPTVGIGFNLDAFGAKGKIEAVGADYDSIRSGKSCLTDSQVMKLFEPSYQSAVSGARRAASSYDSLCCGVQNVMTDMDYNLGDLGFHSFNRFISLINERKWAEDATDGKGTRTAWCRLLQRATIARKNSLLKHAPVYSWPCFETAPDLHGSTPSSRKSIPRCHCAPIHEKTLKFVTF